MKSHRPVLVRDAMRPSSLSVDEAATPRRILAAMDEAGIDELPVVARGGALRGIVERRVVERRLYDREDELARAAMIAEEPVARAAPDERIEAAVDRMLAVGLEVLPIPPIPPRRQLEGVLVLDDLRQVPGLVEGVAESRRRRAIAADAGASKVVTACALVSAVLGLVLLAIWLDGPWYGLPRWVSWVDAVVAVLAFVGAVAASSREMISIPLWAIAGVGLCFTASVAHAWREGPWATLVQLAFAVVFLLMAVVLGASLPRRRHRDISVAATGS